MELSLLLCKFLSREGCSLEFSPTKVSILVARRMVPSGYTAFSNDLKMVFILHKELERKYCMRIRACIGTAKIHLILSVSESSSEIH